MPGPDPRRGSDRTCGHVRDCYAEMLKAESDARAARRRLESAVVAAVVDGWSLRALGLAAGIPNSVVHRMSTPTAGGQRRRTAHLREASEGA